LACAGLRSECVLARRHHRCTTHPPPVSRFKCRQAFVVEAGHPLRDRIARTPARNLGRREVALALADCQERFGPCHMTGWLAVRTADLLQNCTLFFRQRPERIALPSCHELHLSTQRMSTDGALYHMLLGMAILMPNDQQ
jgi:hypothetical protein